MRWARYAVDGARFDERNDRIERVSVRRVTCDALGPPRVWSRENLLHVLERGFDVIAIPPGRELGGLDGRSVRRLSLNRHGCIRADGEDVPGDHLGDPRPR